MNATFDTFNHSTLAPGWPVVVLSKDFVTGRHVGALVQRELSATDPGVSVQSRVWLFSSLDQPSLLRLAVEQALTAHLVVLCLFTYSPLPHGVKDFLRDWLDRCDRRVTPLAVLSAGGRPDEDAGKVGAGSGSDGRPRVPVYRNLCDAVSAARQLARWRSPESAFRVSAGGTWTDAIPSPDGELVS